MRKLWLGFGMALTLSCAMGLFVQAEETTEEVVEEVTAEAIEEVAEEETEAVEEATEVATEEAIEEATECEVEEATEVVEAVTEGVTEAVTEEAVAVAEKEMAEEALYEVEESELIVKNGDNDIYGKLYMPVGEGSFPAVIMAHGYNGSHEDWTKEGQYFASNGIAAYAYDFCGGSTRSKSSMATTEMTIWSEKSDVIAVFNEISALEGIDGEKVFLLGGSQGGFASSLAAEEIGEKAIGMILYFPALCVPDDWRPKYPEGTEIPEEQDFWGMMLGKDFVETVIQIDVFSEIGTYPNPVLIFHGTDDPIVPLSYSEQAAELYPNAKLVVLEGEGHGFTPEAGEDVMKQALAFMQEVIG